MLRFLFSGLLILFAALAVPHDGVAQPFPLPGLGLGSGDEAAAPEEEAPATEAETGEAGGTDAADPAEEAIAANPTQALIDILRDDAARDALIAELEQAQDAASLDVAPAAPEGEAPGDTGGTADTSEPSDLVEPAAEGDVADSTPSVAGRFVGFTEGILGSWAASISDFADRAQRIPRTIALAWRAFDRSLMEKLVLDLGLLFTLTYGTLLVVRLLVRPIRRRLAAKAHKASWARTFGMRLIASLLDIVTIPVASAIAVTAIVLKQGGPETITTLQQIFISAFTVVEMSRMVGRFAFSPRTPDLRLVTLSDAAVVSIWRVVQMLIYLLGYGQLLLVPVVSESISPFVGRALSTVLGAIVVIFLIFYVVMRRAKVARWIFSPPEDGGYFDTQRERLARIWYWPVVIYLVFLLAIVLTRPGNVLLPLLWSTALVVAAVIIGLMISTALTRTIGRRVTVPTGLTRRIPTLQARLNGLIPMILRVLRLVVVLLVIAVVVDLIGLVDISGGLASERGVMIIGRIISFGIVIAITGAIWLALASWVDYRLNPFVGSVPTPRETTLLTLFRNGATIALVIVALMVSLAQLGMNIGPLLASAGVLGLAISFGAQKLVEDIITGVFIQFENAMNVGDVVTVGGVSGVVEKLTVRSVTLRDLSGVVHMIPFSSASMVSNFMRDFSYYLCDMGVAYREDVEEVKRAMHEAFDELRADSYFADLILDDLEMMGLDSFGDSAIVVRARIKTLPGSQWETGRAYNAILKRVFDRYGIEIPFPHQTVYFGEDQRGAAPPVHVVMEHGSGRGPGTEPPTPETSGPMPRDADVATPEAPDGNVARD
ncbi:mechanosensitive ion channel domain-containing protein [Tropicimonas sp. IMCC34011]|uniref:mechanosensitive ion channel domain-containing protein n=1 Tax=Tropicimonas sp. IMCC34011 TaxID=2248759 RepID=UPI001300451D|nr:mechanosensitive ion channel domain-containing protein [Tropicimonas sp. IMCC34011]